MPLAEPEIRRAELDDAPELTRLAGQLGYPMSAAEMGLRLAALLPDERHYVAVVARDANVFGWMHVEHRLSLEGGDRAELMGLVVDSTARRGGFGRALVQAAEDWAAARGLSSLTVRSNVARDQSHPFYEALGYSRAKTQHVYRKDLARQ